MMKKFNLQVEVPNDDEYLSLHSMILGPDTPAAADLLLENEVGLTLLYTAISLNRVTGVTPGKYGVYSLSQNVWQKRVEFNTVGQATAYYAHAKSHYWFVRFVVASG